MTEKSIKEILENYKAVHKRLRNPPNAVPDTGINLRREAPSQPPKPVAKPVNKPKKVKAPPIPVVRDKITLASTLSITASEFGLTKDDLLSRTRLDSIVTPRQVAGLIAHKLTGRSISAIARDIGLDHSSCLHGWKRIKAKMQSDDSFRLKVESIEEKIIEDFNRFAVPANNQSHLENNSNRAYVPLPGLHGMDQGSRSLVYGSEEGACSNAAGKV